MNDFIVMSRTDLVHELDMLTDLISKELADSWPKAKLKMIRSLVDFALKCYDEGEVDTAVVLMYMCGFIVTSTEKVLLSVMMALAESIDRGHTEVNNNSVLDVINQFELGNVTSRVIN